MAHQSPHVAPLDKTRLCHLPCWHPSPRPSPPSPSPFPNHLCHTNTPSCPSAARAHDNSQFCDISRRDRLLMTTRGPRIGDITSPLGGDAKQVSSHRGGFESCELGFQPQQPNGYSGQATEEHDDGERSVRWSFGEAHRLHDSQIPLPSDFPLHSPLVLSILNGCEQLWGLTQTHTHTPPSRVEQHTLARND